jgi:DNA (cytosine-5)-methyltransferase 1
MLTVLDLFSGIGGFALGLENSKHFEVKAFCEIESHCVKVLNKNFPDVPVFRDINKLTINKGQYDVFTGGFPCQDISIAGKNAGINGDRSGLWKQYKRLIKEGKPKYAIIENVSALLGRGLEIILQDLAEIGYDAAWTTYDTKYFGKPQRRRRVYIIAVRDGIPADCDLFEVRSRDITENRRMLESINKSFKWDFKASEGDAHTFTFITRQRSNQFKETGLSSTLAKRDYKSYTDLVLQNGNIRRVTPYERLNLQGFPQTWFNGCALTKQEMFTCNGMSVDVVEYIGKLLFKFDVIVNTEKDADFYADRKYRYIDENFDRGSYFKEVGKKWPSNFSLKWLLKKQDFIDLKGVTKC